MTITLLSLKEFRILTDYTVLKGNYTDVERIEKLSLCTERSSSQLKFDIVVISY